MWQIIGWTAWGIVVLVASLLSYGCRSHVKHGQYFNLGAGVQMLCFWVIVFLFLIFEWNKLHILWIAPLSFIVTSLFFSYLLAFAKLPIPLIFILFGLLSPILIATRIFLSILLIGIEKPPNYYTELIKRDFTGGIDEK